jgi:hypothetical protein
MALLKVFDEGWTTGIGGHATMPITRRARAVIGATKKARFDADVARAGSMFALLVEQLVREPGSTSTFNTLQNDPLLPPNMRMMMKDDERQDHKAEGLDEAMGLDVSTAIRANHPRLVGPARQGYRR